MEIYSQLTSELRYQIYALLKKGHSQTEIAEIIGVNKSTVSRELKRNTGEREYRPIQAHRLALQRREEKMRLASANSLGSALNSCCAKIGVLSR